MEFASNETKGRSTEVGREFGRVRHRDHASIGMPAEVESGEGLRANSALRVARGQRDRKAPALTSLDRLEGGNHDLVEVPGANQLGVLARVVHGQVLSRDGEQICTEPRFVNHDSVAPGGEETSSALTA